MANLLLSVFHSLDIRTVNPISLFRQHPNPHSLFDWSHYFSAGHGIVANSIIATLEDAE